jgi:hypothetical protein
MVSARFMSLLVCAVFLAGVQFRKHFINLRLRHCRLAQRAQFSARRDYTSVPSVARFPAGGCFHFTSFYGNGGTKFPDEVPAEQRGRDRYRELLSESDSRVTLSSSRNAVSFSSACTTKRFPLPRCASAIQMVRPRESTVERQPQLHRLC